MFFFIFKTYQKKFLFFFFFFSLRTSAPYPSSTPDVIFMEGHSEADHSEKTEEILEALAKRHSYSNLSEAAVNAGPYMSPEKLATAASASSSIKEEKEFSTERAQPKRAPVPKREKDFTTVMEADDSLLSMLESMNERIGSLSGTVDSLSNRVESMSGRNDQPILFMPQRVRTLVTERIGQLGTNITSIQSRVDVLANRASQPVLMVPQFK
jgi:hypothetical protein